MNRCFTSEEKPCIILSGLQENDRGDFHQLKALFSNLATDINVENTPLLRKGRSLEKCRPLIVKLKNQQEKAEIWSKAKGLKNNKIWRGISPMT